MKREAGISTRVVGLISTPKQAEAIIADGKADTVALARGFLDNPHWAWHAAQSLGDDVPRPPQYQRAAPKVWPGSELPGLVWRFRSPHHSCRESEMRTSEPKPH